MKINALIFAIVACVFLVGCGEKFDASTESMIKISYNNILKDLDPDERAEFSRQFDLYDTPFQTWCEEGDGICLDRLDIEALHGLSYGDVIDAVAEHERAVAKFQHDQDIATLRNLHVAQQIIDQNSRNIWGQVHVEVSSTWDGGYHYLVAKIINQSQFDLRYIKWTTRYKLPKDGKLVDRESIDDTRQLIKANDVVEIRQYLGYHKLEVANKVLPPSTVFETQVEEYEPTVQAAGMLFMSSVDKANYERLQRQYPEEFEAIVEELGGVG